MPSLSQVPSSSLPERNQHENQRDNSQSEVPQSQPRLRQQVIWLRLGDRNEMQECRQEYHPLTIATPHRKSVIYFTINAILLPCRRAPL
jgi:predicted ferric reductase